MYPNGSALPKQSYKVFISITTVLLGLSGCAPIASIPLTGNDNKAGLIYYMPKRDIVVTLTNVKGPPEASTLAVTVSAPFADLDKRFALTVQGTPIGTRSTDVMVSANGLLMSSSAKLESQVGAIAAQIAAAAGAVRAVWKQEEEKDCTAFTTYSISIPAPKATLSEENHFCGFTIVVASTVAPKEKGDPQRGGKRKADAEQPSAGYFYRQELPYRVTVVPKAGGDPIIATIVNSPSEAPVEFVPVAKALFADNDNLVSFDNGVLKQYKEIKSSELLGLASIPADIIAKYFDAAGKIFGFLNTENTNKLNEINSELRLEIARQRFDSCITAIHAKDDATIDKLGCGK